MKRREEMTPEEIQEFMRREQEELDKMLGKAQAVPAPALAEEEQEEEILSFDPETGKAVQVESTIITRKASKTVVSGNHIQVEGKVKLEGTKIENLSIFEEALKQKAANYLFLKYRNLAWEIGDKMEDMRKFLTQEEVDVFIDMVDGWVDDCKEMKNVAVGVKEIKDLKKIHQDLLKDKMKEYAGELLDIL